MTTFGITGEMHSDISTNMSGICEQIREIEDDISEI